jgi:hypothetical protein
MCIYQGRRDYDVFSECLDLVRKLRAFVQALLTLLVHPFVQMLVTLPHSLLSLLRR